MDSSRRTGDVAEAGRSENKLVSEDIELSGEASALVQIWLKKLPSAARASGEEDEPLEIPFRPSRLGLGAKYLPHSRVATSIGKVENKLRRIIGGEVRGGKGWRGGKRGEEEEEEEVEEEEEEEEEESRVRAFKKIGVASKEKAVIGKEVEQREGEVQVKKKKRRRGVNRDKNELIPGQVEGH